VSRIAPPLQVSDAQRGTSSRLARSTTEPHRVVVRAQAPLMAADGEPNTAIAQRFPSDRPRCGPGGRHPPVTGLDRFAQVANERGRKPTISADKIEQIVNATRFTKPKGKTHWSCREMAAAQGVSKPPCNRSGPAGAQTAPGEDLTTFKLSNHPRFEEKLVDVAGLYLKPARRRGGDPAGHAEEIPVCQVQHARAQHTDDLLEQLSNSALVGCPSSRARACDSADALGTAAPGASAGTTRESTEA
jgi:hypothetical protein